MLETAEVKKYTNKEFSSEVDNKGLNKAYDEFCINNKFKSIDSNLILKNVDDISRECIISAFNSGKEVYYADKENKQEIIYDNGMDFTETEEHIIFINPIIKKNFNGKIESLESLVKNTETFLVSMYKYNNKIKEFSQILERGKFEVRDQYSSSEILEYVSLKFNNYVEKGEKYIGHMNTKSKLDYFPTNFQFQYASLQHALPLNFKQHISSHIKKWLIKNCSDLINNSISDLSRIQVQRLYRKLVNMGRFDIINEVYYADTPSYSSNKIVVADLFAGEGEWLGLYKKMINNRRCHIIANEIEENRFEKIKEKKFNTIINKSYEELVEVPEESISICLFNPPYGEVDGERNVKRFFNMMIEDNYIEAGSGKVIFALREDDTLAILGDIVKYFEIDFASVFRHEGNEYDKLKQICFVATKRTYILDSNLRGFKYERDKNLEKFKMAIKRNYEELTLTNNKSLQLVSSVYGNDINLKLDNLKVKNNPELYISDVESDVWSKVERSLSIETFSGKKVKLPNEPDTFGAIANLISSGLINGEIDGEHPHCLAAGITECTSDTIDDEGNIVTTKKMLPFCSILSGGEIIEIASAKEESDVKIEMDGSVVQL